MAANSGGFPKIGEGRNEPVLDAEIPIIDCHHHLFDRPTLRFMLDDYLENAKLGHNIVATVYIETQAMTRPDGPEEMRPIGEIEFATGVAAMAASDVYGPCRVAAGIVGFADMTLGERIAPLLDRATELAPERFRGVRQIALAHPDPAVLRFLTHKPPDDLLKNPRFLAAFRELDRRGLAFDATVLHHQLPELGMLAARFPNTTIALGHLGLATARGTGAEARAAVFDEWRTNMRDLARHPNVVCKVGGLGTSYWGFDFYNRAEPSGYLELAEAWKPYVETAIEAFGPDRCMMESNFPNDGRSCGFVPLWNAMKHITRNCTATERTALFSGTAKRVFRLAVP